MADKYYLDTSIWLDFHEKRGRNGEMAFKLIQCLIENDFKLFYSDLHVRELKNLGYDYGEVVSIFRIAKPGCILHAHIFREQAEEAKRLSLQRRIPKKDALHAILARDNNLQLISRDRHFEKLKDVALAMKPEEFI